MELPGDRVPRPREEVISGNYKHCRNKYGSKLRSSSCSWRIRWPRKKNSRQKSELDGTVTSTNLDQAEELLTTFFPPLSGDIEDEGPRPQRAPVPMPAITMEEVEREPFAAT
jgi:hypothetical protein